MHLKFLFSYNLFLNQILCLGFSKKISFFCTPRTKCLTLKVPIMTAADDKFGDIFPNFRKN